MVDPGDRCPYPRPFPRDFDGCPAYVPRRWAIHALDGRSLGAVWTCWFLVNGRAPSAGGAFYPRCALGGTASREAWVDRAGEVQVAAYRRFREAVVEVDDKVIAAAEAPVDAGGRAPGEVAEATAARRAAIDRMIDELREAGARHEHLLAGSGLLAEDWILVTEDVLDHDRRHPGHPWRPAPRLLDRISPASRRLVEALAEYPPVPGPDA